MVESARCLEGIRVGVVEFMEEPFEVEIRRENAILTWPNGSRRAIPLHVFRIEAARAGQALAQHDARTAKVIPLRRNKAKPAHH